ncbi:hypothetical protein CERZMDRAFT_81642 [Cercospora zeae-maydis SCOH1-5]|uniref:Uncharacterized protein n=1 Tax=Cercospora zeae-maydis SCOH1-5 TaxID=717836 RepID=A0A6A6FSU1_9PEZI|nr:hypothetical protein CERZMDRAFT_81642 [Cercospora zeae-maydis SCOH1-5]
MAREKRRAISSTYLRHRVADRNSLSHALGQMDSLPLSERYTRAPTPLRHRSSQAQRLTSSRSERSVAPMYPSAQAMAGNYLSQKPVRANGSEQSSRITITHIPSSPPVATPRLPVSHYANENTDGSFMEYEYQSLEFPPDDNTMAPFQSSNQYPRYSSQLAHPFLLLPTPVHQPVSFAFELEAFGPHYFLGPRKTGNEFIERQTYRVRPGSAREITHARFAMVDTSVLSSGSSARRTAPPQSEDNWQLQGQNARTFSYNSRYTSRRAEPEEFVDAREATEQAGESRDASYHLDAVEEQVEYSLLCEVMEDYTESDLPMSDSLPRLPTDAIGAHRPPLAEDENPDTTEAVMSMQDTKGKQGVETEPPRTQRKFVDVASHCG